MYSIAEILDCLREQHPTVVEGASADLSKVRIEGLSSLGASKPSHLAFFFSRAFEGELKQANPGALIIAPPFLKPLQKAGLPFWGHSVVISCADPYMAMAVLSEKFVSLSTAHLPKDVRRSASDAPQLIHPLAVISSTVSLGRGVRVGAHCVIEEGCEIGENVILYPGCYIGPHCKIGRDTVLFPRVTIYEGTLIGERVRLHSGIVLGADGFGYVPQRNDQGQVIGHQKIHHLGKVVVEDDVEIGANSTVDRGTFGETRIGQFSKIDNLVHLGHNTRLDTGAIICGGTCLAGHASVGKFAYVAGVCGISNHVHIGDGAKVGAQTLVSKDVAPGETAVGNPQRSYREHFRAHGLLNKLLSERRMKPDGHDE